MSNYNNISNSNTSLNSTTQPANVNNKPVFAENSGAPPQQQPQPQQQQQSIINEAQIIAPYNEDTIHKVISSILLTGTRFYFFSIGFCFLPTSLTNRLIDSPLKEI